jgi:hypothetical protein
MTMTSSRERRQPRLLLPLLFSVPFFSATPAVASEASELRFSASAQAFYAAMPTESDALNPYGPGLGVRAGVTLPISLYLGVSYEHFFGGEPRGWASVVSVRTEAVADQVTGWAGYELELEALDFRPRVGLGYARTRTEQVVWGDGEPERSQTSEGAVVVSPAVELAFPVGAASFILEGRYTFIPAELAAADVLMIGVGFGIDI